MYVTYDENTMYSTGCSSSLPTEPYIEVDSLDEMFYVLFNCYKVDVENNKVILDEEKRQERINERRNRLNSYQKLGQENTQLQIEMLKLKLELNLPVTYSKNGNDYWKERLKNKYASREQIKDFTSYSRIHEEIYTKYRFWYIR